MIARRPWPPFASPGWLIFYAAGALAWSVIAESWGACLAIGLLAFGLALIAIAWEGLQR